eukprot:TRINITY_DN2767_c2_g1_i1.p1 TRINITY_DN2767_c2_g1~~TRINITY_DN2767_c2_g1_i1.p1  ORF type:complete len:233 (-),score=97.90 TRINITY_DN2767_c2_g1_i1:250-876(-)
MAPTQPKKPVGGAYGIFVAENRPKFAKACEGKAGSAVSKMASEEWKKLSEAAKKPYQTMYLEKKAAYDKELQAFTGAGGVVEKKKRKEKEGGKKSKKDPNAPKKPAAGAYGRFMAEKREEIKKSLPKDHKITDVTKKGGEMWKAMSEASKKPYEEKYQKELAAYRKAMAAYKESKGADAAEDEEEDEDEEEEEPEEKPVAKKTRKAGA